MNRSTLAIAPITLVMLLPLASPADETEDRAALLREAAEKYQTQQYGRAVALASQAIQRDGELVDAYRLRAAAHQQLRQFHRAVADLDRLLELVPNDTGALQMRGELHFKSANIRAALADFDRFLELRPDREPYHWQRGIALYYAGRYEEGTRQFESHKSVNPQDVENAIWHYLCRARTDGVTSARAALIDIDHDRRPWAMDVYQMYQGTLSSASVLTQVERLAGTDAQRRDNQFYTHLYVGLLHESAGRTDEAAQHIKIAVQRFPCPHYMGDVARVHWKLRKETGE